MARILVICGTRPEAIKLFPVIHALADRSGHAVRLCTTGQHRDLVDPILKLTGIVPDVRLDVMRPGQSLDDLVGRLLPALSEMLAAERPDRVIVQGDTASAFAGALAAYHARIPVAHVEAGLRSGDTGQPWPEEAYRRMIAPLADLHFAPTPRAALALLNEGVPGAVHVTGNSVIDALQWTRARLAIEPMLAGSLAPIMTRFAGQRLILVTTHRRESWHAGTGVVDAVATLVERPDVAVLWPLHPRAAIRAAVRARIGDHPRVACVEALDYPHMVRALAACDLVMTDSGGIQEEAPALGKPVLVLRDTSERPEAIEAGTARLVGTAAGPIIAAAGALLDDPVHYKAMARSHSPFGDGRAAARIAALISGGAVPAGRLADSA